MSNEEQGSAAQDSPQEKSLAGTLEGYDMDVDPATGEFVFIPHEAPQAEAAVTPAAPQEPVDGGTDEPVDSPTAEPETSPSEQPPATLEKRLKDTQAALTKSNQARSDLERKLKESDDQFVVLNERLDSVLEMIAKSQLKRQEPVVEPPPSDFPDEGFDTPQQLKAYLDSQIERRAQELASKQEQSPLMRKLAQEMEIRTELQEAVEAYPDFPQYAEEVRQVINKYPEMSFKQAYEIVQQFLPKGGSGNSIKAPSRQESATPQSQPATPTQSQGGTVDQQAEGTSVVDAAIVDRARRLGNVEHPTSGGNVGRGPVKTVKDAMELALEELNMA